MANRKRQLRRNSARCAQSYMSREQVFFTRKNRHPVTNHLHDADELIEIRVAVLHPYDRFIIDHAGNSVCCKADVSPARYLVKHEREID